MRGHWREYHARARLLSEGYDKGAVRRPRSRGQCIYEERHVVLGSRLDAGRAHPYAAGVLLVRGVRRALEPTEQRQYQQQRYQ